MRNDDVWERRTVQRRLQVLATVAAACGVLAGCRAGLGAQLPSRDYVHTFVQRDLEAVRSISTPSLRRAVWDRIGPDEFLGIAALMGHRSWARLVDTRFADDRAVIRMRTQAGESYELRLLYLEPDWRVDDVAREVEPAVYVSQRRQAEAVLAVRDFCKALEAGDARGLSGASSRGFANEVWARAQAASMTAWTPMLGGVRASCSHQVGKAYIAAEGSVAAEAGPAGGVVTYYFVPQNGILLVDDVRPPEGAPTLRARLRAAAGRGR